MAFLSAFYPQPVVKGTTAGTYAEGNHTHELDELDASGISAGKVLTANGSNAATWEDSTGQVEEAPEDGVIYGRKDADWVDITEPANLQIRRGTAAEVGAITPLEGEPVWETDLKKLVIGDGVTEGGVPVGGFPLNGTLRNVTPPNQTAPLAGSIYVGQDVDNLGGQGPGRPYVAGNERGNGAVDLQAQRSQATQVASGNFSSIIAGSTNTVTSEYSLIAASQSSTVSGNFSCLFGANGARAVSGVNSFSYNSNISGSGSVGFLGNCDRSRMFAFGATGSISGFGSAERAQFVIFILKGRTTNSTQTELAIETNTFLTIPNNVAFFGEIDICAIEETSATEYAHYTRKFAIQNLNNTTSLIGSVTTIGTDSESDSAYDILIDADDVAYKLRVRVTGDSEKTLRWIGFVRGCEIDIA
jgi:hypothetical protein